MHVYYPVCVCFGIIHGRGLYQTSDNTTCTRSQLKHASFLCHLGQSFSRFFMPVIVQVEKVFGHVLNVWLTHNRIISAMMAFEPVLSASLIISLVLRVHSKPRI